MTKIERKSKEIMTDFLMLPFQVSKPKEQSRPSDDVCSKQSDDVKHLVPTETLVNQIGEMEKKNAQLLMENDSLSEKIKEMTKDLALLQERLSTIPKTTLLRKNKEFTKCQSQEKELAKVREQNAARYESIRNMAKKLK